MDACLPLRCLTTDFLYLRVFSRRRPHRKHSSPSIVVCIRANNSVAGNALIKSVIIFFIFKELDSAVGIATGYMLEGRGVGVGSRFFLSRCLPDWFWASSSLLSNGYWGHFPRGWSDRGVKLATYLQLEPKSRIRASIDPLPHTPSWRSA
jgi:hypothetical protein